MIINRPVLLGLSFPDFPIDDVYPSSKNTVKELDQRTQQDLQISRDRMKELYTNLMRFSSMTI